MAMTARAGNKNPEESRVHRAAPALCVRLNAALIDGHKIARRPIFLRVADEDERSLVGHDDIAAQQKALPGR
jgi:hypothetical protein